MVLSGKHIIIIDIIYQKKTIVKVLAMKFCAIICEYNPLHLMHRAQIEFARSKSECDFLICLMSGSYVQRGQTAFFDKYTRAKHALLAGADIVLELPLLSAAMPADDFALGAVRILKEAGVEALSFGCESGNAEEIGSCAEILGGEAFDALTGELLKAGMSYPAAAGMAAARLGSNILDNPNDLLAVSYVRAGISLGYRPELFAMKRETSYNGTSLLDVSAKAVRLAFEEERDFSEAVPDFVYADREIALSSRVFSDFAFKYLQLMNAERLGSIYGVSEGLENRILSVLRNGSEEKFFEALRTKRYTDLRLRRVIMNAVLGITDEIVGKYKACRPYTRLLGVKKGSESAIGRFSAMLEESVPDEIAEIEYRADRLYEALCGRVIKGYPVKL